LVNALEYSVVFAAHKANWQSAASALLPVAAWSEEDGTYTNCDGRVQFAGQAITPGGDILPLWEVLAQLLYVTGDAVLWLNAEDVFASMSEQSPAFKGIKLEHTHRPGALASS